MEEKLGGSMKVTGETMIFRSEKGYSTSISNKNQNGEWESMYISVTLPKGTNIENKTKINVTDGFLSFWKDKNGLARPKLVVMKYQMNDTNVFNYESDELPF